MCISALNTYTGEYSPPERPSSYLDESCDGKDLSDSDDDTVQVCQFLCVQPVQVAQVFMDDHGKS